MRISQRNEWIVLGVLIVALATSTGASTLRSLLNTTIGRVVGLAAIIYVWKKVSAPVSLLLVVMYIRYSGAIEGMENKKKEKFENQTCQCESGFTWDATIQSCKNNEGAIKKPTSCTCEESKMWDASKGECVEKVKPESMPTPTPTNAPATSNGPVTNNNTVTTPGAAMEMASKKANEQVSTSENFTASMGGDLKNKYASF